MTSESLPPQDLRKLAQAAGIAVQWRDAQGQPKTVSSDVLLPFLAAMDLPAHDDAHLRDSLQRVREQPAEGPLLIGRAETEITLTAHPGAWTIEFDNGAPPVQGQAQACGSERVSLRLPAQPGYHRLLLGDRMWQLAVAPARAPSIDDIAGRAGTRIWGPVAQLYSLRRDHGGVAACANGFGDFAALAELAQRAASQGADALAISPVHAMFAANPGAYSPYGPSSRLFLNAAYADPAELFGLPAVNEAIASLGCGQTVLALDRSDFIDWPQANRVRYAIMRHLFDHAYAQGARPGWHDDFETFIAQGGQTLQRHARFEALHAEHVRTTGQFDGWRGWPSAWRDPDGTAVEQFATEHVQDVRFHAFGQWLAARGLGAAQATARSSGMRVGLIADLAVGTDPGGSHAWSRQRDLLNGLSSGAPPDIYNTLGQGWGLTAFSPAALKANGYSAFIEMLRAVLAHAGGIRIDHVLGLARTWLVPDGNKPADGAYLQFPLQDMLNLIALEAWRHQAIVIGENLGTVPDGFNETIATAGMLGMNVLLFERDYDGGVRPAPFVPASRWPRDYLATSTTHDLPTLAGWWAERDLDWKVKLDLLSAEQSEHALREERQGDRRAMADALATLPGDSPVSSDDAVAPVNDMLRWTCSGPQPLALIPLEDLLHLVEQPNIPGTIDTHPNWRRRLPATTDTLFDQPETRAAVAAITSVRSRS